MHRLFARLPGAMAVASLLLATMPALADPPDHAKGWKHARFEVDGRLPPGHRVVHHHGVRYYYDRGAWYRPYGSHFMVVAPPIGLTIPFRPDFHATLWFGGVPYYRLNSVYFVWEPGRHGYVVTPAPW